jgi:conjugative transfer signal peptidase TraF
MKDIAFGLLTGVFVVLALSLPDALKHSQLRFNSTDSVPVGLYETEAVRAPYAGVCLSAETLRTALAAGLELGRGECADGHQPVLKTVYEASLTSPVVFDADGFAVGNQRIPNTRPKAVSKKGKPLTHYAFGIYTAGLWAISGHSADSFDSRYFGPVSQQSLRFYAKPLLVF